MRLKALNILTVRFAENGITTFVMNYYRGMAADAIAVDFVAPNEPPEMIAREIAARGGQVFVLPQRNKNPLSYMAALSKIVRRGGYDIVHAHGNSATLYVEMRAAQLSGARVRVAHSHNTSCKQVIADRLLRPLFYRSYTHALACGKAAGKWLFPNRPFTVVQNAVDARAFAFDPAARADMRVKLGLSDAPVACHVGSFNAQKNHAFLLAAFAALQKELPFARLLLVGGGPLMEDVRAETVRLGVSDRVIFAGSVPDAAPYLFASDLFALPSLYEGLPFTLIEAQLAGLPCVVSDAVTREAYLMDDVTALPVAGGEAVARWADAMADELRKTRADEARIQAGEAAAAAARARGYSIAQNAEALLALYRSFLAETGAGA